MSLPSDHLRLKDLIDSFVTDTFQELIAGLQQLATELNQPKSSMSIHLDFKLNTEISGAIVSELTRISTANPAEVVFATKTKDLMDVIQKSQFNSAQAKGLKFEHLCILLLRNMGFETRSTVQTGDGGIDIVAFSKQPLFAGKYIIQCKAWKQPVGEPIVRDLFGVVHAEHANKGILITTSRFTDSAIAFANGKPLELINGEQLRHLVQEYLPDNSNFE